MIPIGVEYNDKHGGIYLLKEGETVQELIQRIVNTENEQGRPIANLFGLKLVFGSVAPAFFAPPQV